MRPSYHCAWAALVVGVVCMFVDEGVCQGAPVASVELPLGKSVDIPVANYKNHAVGPGSETVIATERANGGVTVTGIEVGDAKLHVFDQDMNRTDYQIRVVPAAATPAPAPTAPAPPAPTPPAPTPPSVAPAPPEVTGSPGSVSISTGPRSTIRRLTPEERKSQAKNLEAVIARPTVKVEVSNGTIMLTGSVADEREKQRAQRLAELLATNRVINKLRVAPAGETAPTPEISAMGGPVLVPGTVGAGTPTLTPELTPALETIAEGAIGAPASRLTLPTGRSQILSTTENIMKVVVADGEVVTAEVISARQALFIGQTPGVTDAYLVVEQFPHDPLGSIQHYVVQVPEQMTIDDTVDEEPEIDADQIRFQIENALSDLPGVNVTVIVPLWKRRGGGGAAAGGSGEVTLVNPAIIERQPGAAAAGAALSGGVDQPGTNIIRGSEDFTVILRGHAPTEADVQRAGEIAAIFGGTVLNYVQSEEEAPEALTIQELRLREAQKIEALLKEHLDGLDTIDVTVSERGIVLTGTAPSQRIADRATRLVDALADWEGIRLIAPNIGATGVQAPPTQGGAEMMIVNPKLEGFNKQGGFGKSKGPTALPMAQAEGVINLLQIVGRVQMVVTQARIVEIDRSALTKLGIDWGTTDQAGGAGVGIGTTGTVGASKPGSVAFGENGPPGVAVTRLTSLVATLDMLEETGKAHTLSAPDLTTLEGTPANLVVGGQVPIPAATFTGGGGGGGGGSTAGQFATQSVEFRPFGILLTVLPEATEGGHIMMQLRVEVSAIDYANSISILGTEVPGFKLRQVTDSIAVQDGDTIVIGGMISREDQETWRRIPYLSRIPILGKLFQHKRFERGETELVIFLTPRVHEEPASIETIDFAQQMRDFNRLEEADVGSTFGGLGSQGQGGGR